MKNKCAKEKSSKNSPSQMKKSSNISAKCGFPQAYKIKNTSVTRSGMISTFVKSHARLAHLFRVTCGLFLCSNANAQVKTLRINWTAAPETERNKGSITKTANTERENSNAKTLQPGPYKVTVNPQISVQIPDS